MQDSIIIEGKDYEGIIKEAEEKFDIKRDKLKIELLENRKSFFGSYYKVKVSLADDLFDKLECVLDNLEDQNAKRLELTKIDETIDIIYKEDGVYLKIGEEASLEHVFAHIAAKQIKEVNNELIKDFFNKKKFNELLKIAENQIEDLIDCVYSVKIEKDIMQAFLNITEPYGGKGIIKEELLTTLKEKNVTYGIKYEAIDEIIMNKIYNKDVLIAEGQKPINGEDAKLDYKIDIKNQRKISINMDGKIDYHELSLIQNVKVDQLLVQLIPNTVGIPGKNVLGLDVPAKDGKKLTLPKGKNIEIGIDGYSLVSSIDGQVELINDKVTVSPIYEVKSDVDNSTGNIRFIGKVIVRGNVLTGFKIEADDDIEVFGVVEGASIVSQRDIILHRGMQGMNRGELICEGDLVAKFIENSKVEVKGNIVSDAIMHSNVICGKKLELKGRKGLIVGGQIRASEEISAKVIGSPMATITDLEVGINPDIRKKYESMREETKQLSQNLEKAKQAVELLTKISKTSELSADKRLLLSRSIQLKLQLAKQLEDMKGVMVEMETYLEEITNGKIKASEVIFPGTRISIGSSKMYIKEILKFATIYRDRAEIKVGPYEE